MKEKVFSEPIVKCKACGKEVKRTSNRQWWCSRNCGERFKRKLASQFRKKNPKFKKTCRHCDKIFTTNLSRKKFCTIKCKEDYHNKIQKNLKLRTPYKQKKLCGGNWRQAIKNARGKCELCGITGTTKQLNGLVVHHLDGNGEYDGFKYANNYEDNLMVLCRKCHKLFHNLSLVFVNGQWEIKGQIIDKLGFDFQCNNDPTLEVMFSKNI